MSDDTIELRLAVLDDEARAQVAHFAGFLRQEMAQAAEPVNANAMAEALSVSAVRSAERASREFASLLIGGLNRAGRAGGDIFDDLWARALAGAQRFATSLAATLLDQSFVLPIVAQLKGVGPLAGGGLPGPSLSGRINSIAQLAGIGPVFGASPAAAATAIGPTAIGAIPAIELAGGIMGAPLSAGGLALGGAAPGTAALGALGGALPYIGAGIAVASLLAGSLFKKKPTVGPGQAVTLQQGMEGLDLLRIAQDNEGSLDLAGRYANSAPKGFDALFDVLGGGRFAAGTAFNIGNNRKEGFQYSVYAPGQVPGGRESVAEAKNLANAEEAVAQAFLKAIEHGLVEGLSGNFKAAFDALKPETSEELADIVGRVKAYEAAIKPLAEALTPATSALGQAIKANTESFDALRDSARELSLALEPLNAAEAERLAALRQGFTEGLETQARAATGQGFINALLGVTDQANALAASNVAGFGDDRAALDANQDLINTIFAGGVEQALAGLSVAQLEQVVAFFADSATTTGDYIEAVARHLTTLGGAAEGAEEAVGGLTQRGDGLLSALGVREMRLAGDDRAGLEAELAAGKARELAEALAEGFNPEQLLRLTTVINGEVLAALEAFDVAVADTADAVQEAADRLEAERIAGLRAGRDFDAGLTIREARLAGDDRRALVLELAAQKTAAMEAAEAAGRTAEQLARLSTVLNGEATRALEDFDTQLGTLPGTVDAATGALRRLNDDLAVRDSALTGDALATALLQFDLDAAQQRMEAAAIAGADLVALERVLAGERLRIVADWNARLAQEQARAGEAAAREAAALAEAQRRAQEDAARAAEEAARRIADAMRQAAAAMDDYRVRDLRAQGLDREAEILAKQLSNAQELKRIDELIRAGGTNIDRKLVERVLARELQNVIEGVASGAGRGRDYDPQSYDRFFTVAASAALVNAREGLRDADLLRSRNAVALGTSNVIPFPVGGGSPLDGTAPAPADFQSLRPFSAASFVEVETLFGGFFGSLREPLAGIHEDTTTMVALLKEILTAVRSGRGGIDIDVFAPNRSRRHTRPAGAPPPVLDWAPARFGSR